jgi:hypothetical protein
MELTPANKQEIDDMSYGTLLVGWRFAKIGDPRFQGEHGEYWAERMAELRKADGGEEMHVRISRIIGWD